MFVICYAVVVVLLRYQAGEITASMNWPEGTYALPKPKTGCPEAWKNNGWVDGSMEQITVSRYYRRPNEKSDYLNMSASVNPKNLEIEFCISKRPNLGPPAWPKGEYCVYSKHWVQGMIWGQIRLYDSQSKTTVNNACESSFFYENGKDKYLYFKCQINGNKRIPISLPITKPFYLLPYGSSDCQQVEWMIAKSEWIKDYTYSYRCPYGEIPHLDLKYACQWKELKTYYCYYKSCNYTLTDKKDVFQSPGFPAQYPDGQLCSWTIRVQDNHTVVVSITKFALFEYDGDSLQLYKNNSRVFKLNQTFIGYHRPFTITATSDLLFVFRSDEEHSSNGFRAEYEIFKTPESTTTASPKPPTTTSPPTTTTQPTTKLTTTQPPTTKQPTTKLPTTTEATTKFPTSANVNSTTNETVQCTSISNKDKSYDKHINPLVKKTCFCDETWRIVVMVIPLAVFVLTVLVIIDIVCRCRYKRALKSGASGLSANKNERMVVNPTYERGNIVLDQPADTSLTDTSTVNTVDEQPQSRDEPPDYEDVDYTQVDEVPPPRRSMKRQECHALQPVGNDTSAVFYHVLEHPESAQDQPQSRVPGPAGNGTRHTLQLELLTESGRPTYQNLSELNHYTLNPLYEAAENSPPLVEANRLYDNYIA